MNDTKKHRGWIIALIMAMVVGVGHGPILTNLRHQQDMKYAELLAQTDKAATALKQLRGDIAETEQLKAQLGDANPDEALAGVDRLRVATQMEQRAKQLWLTELNYNFAPEEEVVIDNPGLEPQKLAKSHVTLSALAPTDVEAKAFIQQLSGLMPGKLTLQQVRFERVKPYEKITAANIRMTVAAEWLSNGASTENVGNHP